MTKDNALGKPLIGTVDGEAFIYANSGLNKRDCDTVMVQINQHVFLFTFQNYLDFLQGMATNAEQFHVLRAKFQPTPNGTTH